MSMLHRKSCKICSSSWNLPVDCSVSSCNAIIFPTTWKRCRWDVWESNTWFYQRKFVNCKYSRVRLQLLLMTLAQSTASTNSLYHRQLDMCVCVCVCDVWRVCSVYFSIKRNKLFIDATLTHPTHFVSLVFNILAIDVRQDEAHTHTHTYLFTLMRSTAILDI